MRTPKTSMPHILLTIALMFVFLTSCEAQLVKPNVPLKTMYLTSYETKNHVLRVTVLNPVTGQIEKIPIELEDEISLYYFAVAGKEYEIEYKRTGSQKLGCTGVFVIFQGEIYQIDSPFKRLER